MRMMRGDAGVFATLQGEGELVGTPTTFVRLAGCDLRCAAAKGNGWSCDTPTSLPDYDVALGRLTAVPTKFAEDVDVRSVAERILLTQPSHVAITGGEPTLQGDEVVELLGWIDRGANGNFHGGGGQNAANGRYGLSRPPHATIETNGRHFHPGIAARIDLVTLSPKVMQPETIYVAALDAWLAASKRVQVKVPVSTIFGWVPAIELFRIVRARRPDALLYVQRADVPDTTGLAEVRADIVRLVRDDPEARALGVRYGIQQHKVIDLP